MADFTELKQKHRATWAAGDYNQIAQGIQAVADHVVRSGRIRAGERVLDLACGTGNTALMARARSAMITGIVTPPFIESPLPLNGTVSSYAEMHLNYAEQYFGVDIRPSNYWASGLYLNPLPCIRVLSICRYEAVSASLLACYEFLRIFVFLRSRSTVAMLLEGHSD